MFVRIYCMHSANERETEKNLHAVVKLLLLLIQADEVWIGSFCLFYTIQASVGFNCSDYCEKNECVQHSTKST